MAKSNADRQRAYRQRARHSNPSEGGRQQVAAMVSATATGALKRLAQYHGLTRAKMLDRLLRAAEDDLLDGRKETTVGIKTDSPEYDRYWHGVTSNKATHREEKQ